MNFYITSLFVAIPSFMVLVLIEQMYARYKGVVVNNHADMISSLSSGMTNITKDVLKIGIVIISYSWLVDIIAIVQLEKMWLIVLCALIVQDFTGYWLHRLNHRVNLLWNRHIIHHSSEEFNLSCALRQSISQTFKYAAIFMVPAALLGIPASIFVILGPIHLFMQFWYHTRLINKMGFLEYFLVTPSHHRVHHAINPQYLDKNYGQIFIIWDKLFGTFQEELSSVEPVYGTLRPSSTWNPILINFKHLWQLIKDAWHAEKLIDKVKIWFMPTGWRPADVQIKFPVDKIEDPFKQKKYAPFNSNAKITWSWIQHGFGFFIMFHLLIGIEDRTMILNYLYTAFLLMHIFSFTTMLDNKSYLIISEFVKIVLLLFCFIYQGYTWFDLDIFYSGIILGYVTISFFITYYFHKKSIII